MKPTLACGRLETPCCAMLVPWVVAAHGEATLAGKAEEDGSEEKAGDLSHP